MLPLIRDVAPSIEYEKLAPVISEFERNDHNIWVKAVPALQPLLSRQLRGTLTRLSSQKACGVVLIPLAKDQPGWRPVAPQGLHDVWPPGVAGERYRLELTAAAHP